MMRTIRRIISIMLVLGLFISSFTNTGLAEVISRPQGEGEVNAAYGQFVLADGEVLTWAQGAKRVSALLGFLDEDAADIDLELYADKIAGLSASDDSVYLAILAQHGYLSLSAPIDPLGEMPADELALLIQAAFSAAALDQEAASELAKAGESGNVIVAGDGVSLSALNLRRVAVGRSQRLTLSAIEAEALSVIESAQLDIKRSEIERAYINTPDEPVYMHIDRETIVPVIAIEGAGDVVIEGSGALGLVRVMGEVASLTVRATGSVVNETEADITLLGPQGEVFTLAPDAQADLTLTKYLVTFVTDGTPVATQEIAPGGSVDFGKAHTELEGKIFTAWYKDADYYLPYSMLASVDEQLTLHARFIDEAEAAIITFETFGGRELAPLVFAKGENLLCKPTANLYTSKEGFAFGGWCVDEECTVPFGYTDIILDSMTLYAMFMSDEVQEEEKGNSIAELHDFDWRDTIKLTAPEGMSVEDVSANVVFELGTGGIEPQIAFRETDGGFEMYATHYSEGDEIGFEPGSTFTVTLSGGTMFADYPADIESLVVSVYREEVSIVKFTEGLTYVLWQDVSDYVPVISGTGHEVAYLPDGSVDEREYQGSVTPGSLMLDAGITLKPDEVVVFYDGDIADDEDSITSWEGGALDGYVLFAQILSTQYEAGKTRVSFVYADPNDYLDELDVHITRDVNIEEQLSKEDLARAERSIREQVASNEELNALLLMSVMTSPDTQKQLDEIYGSGVYSLATMSVDIRPNPAIVKVNAKDKSVTASVTVSATIMLKEGGRGNLAMTITPRLTFEEQLSVSTSVDGGNLWVDASVTLKSKTTIRLEIISKSGSMDPVLSETEETLKRIISPEGLDNNEDHVKSFSTLMDTMQDLMSTNLVYNSLYEQYIFTAQVSLKGIITLKANVDLVGQVGIIATFGIELTVESGQKIGFKYDFKDAEGNSYKKKLSSKVNTQIHLIGKVGVRVGLRLTISITVCLVAKTSITGTIFVYAELTGMFFYTASLLTGDNTYFGAMYFEVGADASIRLNFTVDLVLYTYEKNWTLWKAKWKFWSMEKSSSPILMDNEKLDELWSISTNNARGKTVFGFDYVPMKTYTLMNGTSVDNQMLWDSPDGKQKLKFEILNLRINGAPTMANDPRNAVVALGDGSQGRALGKLYVDEMVAVEHLIELVECDVKITYENNVASALVKKQEKTFAFSREMTLATNTVNVQIALYDWCAHAWGIEAADWDGAIVYNQPLVSTHVLGMLIEPSKTEQLDLAAIERSALRQYPEINDISLSWNTPTRNNMGNTIQYGIPRVSNLCYMTPDNGTIRYDIYPQTSESTITWYMYVSRFPGFSGDVEYIVRAPMLNANNEHLFTVRGGEYDTSGAGMQFAAVPEQLQTWNLMAHRSAFDGTDQPLMLSINGMPAAPTGLTINGREATDKVELSLSDAALTLDIKLGEGVTGYELLSPAINKGEGIAPGTEVKLSVTADKDYGGITLASQPEGLNYTSEDGIITFIMPAYPVKLTLTGHKVWPVLYLYNYGDMGRYKRELVAENEKVLSPKKPDIDGLTFRGWYTSPECIDAYAFGRNPSHYISLYADWTCNVTIDFGVAMGQAVYIKDDSLELVFEGDDSEYSRFTYSTQRVGENPLNIMLPNYSGYDFMGWYTSSDYSGIPIDMANYALTGGVTFYARWVKFVKVSYQLNYEDAGEYFMVLEHLGLPFEYVPEPPTRDYYSFTGWYTNSSAKPEYAYEPSENVPEGDLTLYAGWTPDPFAITYDLAGGENDAQNPSEYTVESGDIALNAPSRVGYDFAGWTGTELDAPTLNVVIPSGAHIERSYTATWTAIDYPITYNLVRGATLSPNPDTYTIEDGDIVLINPVKEKYDFTGWIGTDLTEPTMEVTIPTGSIGARAYTATWVTDDPAEQIADYAIAAVANSYTYDIDDFVSGVSSDSSIYVSARADIDSSADSAPYSGDIELELTALGDAVESDTQYTYTFTAKTTYTDDTGNSLTREKTVTAFVMKRVPVINSAFAASDILYAQTLGDSAFINASAEYSGEAVAGAFAWEDASIVPLGADNGLAKYAVVFTPNDTSIYAKVTLNIAVNTQISVKVTITPNDRDYIAGSTKATGTAALTDYDTGAPLTDIALTGGSWRFSQIAPGDELTVTYTGYSLSTPSGDKNLYVLANTSAKETASIRWITPKTTAPTATMTYDQKLGDVALVGGSARYTYNNSTIKGSWDWVNKSARPSAAGEQVFNAVFTPDDTIGYKSVTMPVKVNVKKAVVKTITFKNKAYTASKQVADVPSSDLYKVKANNGGTDVGTYNVVLTLKEPGNYRWSNDTAGTQPDYTTSFDITPVDISVNGTASVTPLGYGQRLSKGNTVGDTQISAADMISGLRLTFNGTTVTGKWAWNLTSAQEGILDANDPSDAELPSNKRTGYQVSATFTPTYNNFNSLTRTFTVVVKRSTPDLSDCDLSCSSILLTTPQYNTLNQSIITCANAPKNAVTGASIEGSWDWPNGDRVPSPTDREFNAVFSPVDTDNYLVTYSDPLTVPFHDKISIKMNVIRRHYDGGYSYIYNGTECDSYTVTGVTPNAPFSFTPALRNVDVGGGEIRRTHVYQFIVDGYFNGVHCDTNTRFNYPHRLFEFFINKGFDPKIKTSLKDGVITLTFDPNYIVTGDMLIYIDILPGGQESIVYP